MKQDSQSSTAYYAKISVNFKDSEVISFKKASEFSGCLPRSQKWSSNQDPLYQKTLTGHHQLFDE